MRFAVVRTTLVLLLVISVFANTPIRTVLFDDLNDVHYWDAWEYQHDTLTTYGVGVHYTSDEGWSNIMAMDMVWVQSPSHSMYTTEEIAMFQNYVRNNGRMLIGIARDPEEDEMEPMDRLLTDSGWQTTLGLFPMPEYSDTGVVGSLFVEFSPFTADIRSIFLSEPPGVSCGVNAYPFAFAQNNYDRPVTAISYPFLNEGNCSSYIVLTIGNHTWESGCESYPGLKDTYIFARNILLTMAGVPGYELPPGAIPGGGFAPGCGEQADTTSECFAHPSPFTPNGDGINDFAKFEYPGMHRDNGVAYIYTLENEFVRKLQNGEVFDSPKGIIYWDGKDGYDRLMENGVYLYIIQDNGETVCKGTVYLAR